MIHENFLKGVDAKMAKFKKRIDRSEAKKPSISLNAQADAEEAYELIENGKFDEAIQLLRPLVDKHRWNADLIFHLGYAYHQTGDLWQAVIYLSRVLKLQQDPELYGQLAYIYLQLNLQVLGLHAFRRAIQLKVPEPMFSQAQQVIAGIEADFSQIAKSMRLSIETAEKGFQFMEEGQIALQTADYAQCIHLNHNATKILGAFPPPRNNLSLALFFSGQWKEAIQAAQQVLGFDEQNIQALANIVRFLAWTGQETEASVYWERLKQIFPLNNDLRVKMAEAAAVVEDDETVHNLLKGVNFEEIQSSGLRHTAKLRLAIAEANLHLPTAKKKMSQMKGTSELANGILNAMKDGKTGLGWTNRFPYFTANDYLPRREIDKLLNLLQQQDRAPSKRPQKEIREFAARFPQIVIVAKKFIFENQHIEAGINLLERIGTPTAFAALREFGVSQVANDEDRTKALFALMRAGQIQPNEPVRIWVKGEWRDIQLKQYEIADREEPAYSPKVANLINQGLEAYQSRNMAKAEQLFLQAVQLEPKAVEAYNNLGTIYAHRKEHDQAKAMFQKAVNAAPLYVMARCNLAIYSLDDENVEQAEKWIEPLVDVSQFTPQMMVFLSYVRARIAVMKEEYEQALNHLEIANKIDEDFQPVQELLARVRIITNFSTGFKEYRERTEKRRQAARAKQQKQLSTTAPSLKDVISLYTKEALTGMAREMVPSGGWSTLKKAELAKYLTDWLQDFDNLKWMVDHLKEEDRKALKTILDQDGVMPWQEFSNTYGNDLDESPYWQYHLPETTMGRLRIRGLLGEVTVNGDLLLAIPGELRGPLSEQLRNTD